MINLEIIENVRFKRLGTMQVRGIPPINAHLILQGINYIIIDYVIVDSDINVWKMVVRKATSNDQQYTAIERN